ncbi:hypothetical protein COLO4_08821 [Corchorus olitorius]|uniref:Uncharacterized protein n=1 Tax=Corchorus olitorius TaxID=93759 RepID=A0A1R3KEL5_9ROSI|nr:hypothetical protein COLO4_08821 [Corchorus olitorius]
MLTCWTGNDGAYGIVNLKLGVYGNMVVARTVSKSYTCGSSILHPTWLGSALTSIHVCFIVVLPLEAPLTLTVLNAWETLMCTQVQSC